MGHVTRDTWSQSCQQATINHLLQKKSYFCIPVPQLRTEQRVHERWRLLQAQHHDSCLNPLSHLIKFAIYQFSKGGTSNRLPDEDNFLSVRFTVLGRTEKEMDRKTKEAAYEITVFQRFSASAASCLSSCIRVICSAKRT